jgi:hypothetical protein
MVRWLGLYAFRRTAAGFLWFTHGERTRKSDRSELMRGLKLLEDKLAAKG